MDRRGSVSCTRGNQLGGNQSRFRTQDVLPAGQSINQSSKRPTSSLQGNSEDQVPIGGNCRDRMNGTDSLAPARSALAVRWLRPDSFRRFPSDSSYSIKFRPHVSNNESRNRGISFPVFLPS